MLTAYNNQLYDPNSVSTYSSSYTTTQGLQSNSRYSIINNTPDTIVTINSENGILTYYTSRNTTTTTTNVVAINSLSLTSKPYGYNINSFTLQFISEYITTGQELYIILNDANVTDGILENDIFIDYTMLANGFKVLTSNTYAKIYKN